ncbi:MAG TPA: hypothetical protein VMF06_10615 [Candidatus Limnocylindria bacterium]|nr:hypothetical protein [Candidatus Limnocylindria bacterium]
MASCLFAAETDAPTVIKPIDAVGLHNVFSIGERYFSGNAPETDEAFATLQKLGIKTLLSVDGSKPDVERAAKFGLHYIHLPFGYGGIPETNVVRLIKAAQSVEGPIYVHCHHGLHRGPAAVAVICEGTLGWSTNQAVTWMKQAGTSPDYQGLFKAASEFHAPTPAELAKVPSKFPAVAPTGNQVDAMVEIDHHWDLFKAAQKTGFKTAENHPEKEWAHEALLLAEGFRELQRREESKALGDDFVNRLHSAEQNAMALKAFVERAKFPLDEGAKQAAEKVWTEVGQSCSSCHKKYRN